MAPTKSRLNSSISSGPLKTLIIDNGAYTIKAGFSSPDIQDPTPSIIPNCIARDQDKKIYIGSDFYSCKEYSEIAMRRPVEKGYVVNWEAQKEIWEHEFFDEKAKLNCDPKETGLILTEAPNALPALQTFCDQMVFEEFGFQRYLRCSGPQLNAYNDIQSIFKAPPRALDLTNVPPAEILMLIDTSYSHTTITPLLLGKPLQSAVRRLEVGGKLLTNHLRNLLNQRAPFDLSNETYIISGIKEEICYVSKDFKADVERTWKGPKGDRRSTFEMGGGIAKDYVLPNFKTGAKGYMRDHIPPTKSGVDAMTGRPLDSDDDIVTLRNERFVVPELLFNPLDIGISQSGVAQQVMNSLSALPMGLWPGFLANIVVVGGTSNLEGFITRLQMEIRALAPAECIVRVAKAPDPIISTWRGGASLARDEQRLKSLSVTKEEYDEYGAGYTARKFSGK